MTQPFATLPREAPAKPFEWFLRIREHACPICAAATWQEPKFGLLIMQHQSARSEPREILVIACRTCGYMLHFDAALMGFTPDSPPRAQTF